jgi:protein tyrosine phosphatase (PTP) superfamily phosphohydrolase (DUF442 family)
MDTVNSVKETKQPESKRVAKQVAKNGESNVSPSTKHTTPVVDNESVTNEAQAAFDIQAALHAYCKVSAIVFSLLLYEKKLLLGRSEAIDRYNLADVLLSLHYTVCSDHRRKTF